MRKPHPNSEELLENASLAEIFHQLLRWEPINAYRETLGENGTLGRTSQDKVSSPTISVPLSVITSCANWCSYPWVNDLYY